MDKSHKSGLRELQIAQGVVTLRWVAIPILFLFGILATRYLGMTFPITPIYALACILAIMNVYFTVHISMLSRQLMLRHGIPAIKRFMGAHIGQFLQKLRDGGLLSLVRLPQVILKMVGAMYLMILEAIKGLPLNLLSIKNVMHSQVILDVMILSLFIRFTGSSESPMLILLAIPIITSGAVMGFYAGGVYALGTSLTYLLICLLVNFRLIDHMKFYGPQYGDLSQSIGWTLSSFIMLLVGLLGTAYLAHHLTAVFKERIYFLSQLLSRSRRDSMAQGSVAENVSVSWFILDGEGKVLRYKVGKTELFSPRLHDKNILDAIPAFRQHGLGYILQSVITSGKSKDIGRIKIQVEEGTLHTVTCRVIPMVGEDGSPMALTIVEDITEIVFLKERVNELKEDLDATKAELEKTSLDSKEANLHLVKSLKQANERSVEIAQHMARIRELEDGKNRTDEQLMAVMKELAGVKAANDTLAAELKYKQMILEEIIELLKNCTHLDHLTEMIERRTKTLFKLDNACLHIFAENSGATKMAEILDTRKVSPKLLDLPRKNPKVLEPVINDGKPVVIMAEVHPDKSASMAISNGNMRRLVAYIPIRHDRKLLGMMMLDRYGQDDNTEKLLEMLVYYLGHTAFALKNAISTKDWVSQKEVLSHTIDSLEKNITGLTDLIAAAPGRNEEGFGKYLSAVKQVASANDATIVRFHSDGSNQTVSRTECDSSVELAGIETEIIKTLKSNPAHKVTVKENNEGRILLGYPLKQGNNLIGALLLVLADAEKAGNSFLDAVARLTGEHLSMVSLQEEKELWENFYQENLKA
jgi:transcriptional regulator with GAF, ATPase, and Fis domain